MAKLEMIKNSNASKLGKSVKQARLYEVRYAVRHYTNALAEYSLAPTRARWRVVCRFRAELAITLAQAEAPCAAAFPSIEARSQHEAELLASEAGMGVRPPMRMGSRTTRH